MAAANSKTFQARPEQMPSRLRWVIVWIPFAVPKSWKQRGRVRVRGQINGYAFRTSLFPSGQGKYYLLVNKTMQREGGARAGMAAKFRLEPDTEERVAAVPAELAHIFKRERQLQRWHAALTYSARKYFGDMIGAVKNPEARMRRAEQMAELMMATMEAEVDLPPAMVRAFAEHHGAREGWEMMTATQRRGHLMGIFYYRTPEGRARRTAKAIEAAIAVRERKGGKRV